MSGHPAPFPEPPAWLTGEQRTLEAKRNWSFDLGLVSPGSVRVSIPLTRGDLPIDPAQDKWVLARIADRPGFVRVWSGTYDTSDEGAHALQAALWPSLRSFSRGIRSAPPGSLPQPVPAAFLVRATCGYEEEWLNAALSPPARTGSDLLRILVALEFGLCHLQVAAFAGGKPVRARPALDAVFARDPRLVALMEAAEDVRRSRAPIAWGDMNAVAEALADVPVQLFTSFDGHWRWRWPDQPKQ